MKMAGLAGFFLWWMLTVVQPIPGEEGKLQKPTQVGDLIMDKNLKTLKHLINESPPVRKRLSEGIEGGSENPLLYEIEEGRLSEDALHDIRQACTLSIRKAKRYEGKQTTDPKPTSVFLGESRVARVDITYPEVSLSKKEKRGRLIIRLWLCPDRNTAIALFWLRRGGAASKSAKQMRDMRGSMLRYPLSKKDMQIGDMAYSYYPQVRHSIALGETHGVVSANRIGFIYENIVIEGTTYTAFREKPNQEWKTGGMSRKDIAEIVGILREIDRWIKRRNEAKKPIPASDDDAAKQPSEQKIHKNDRDLLGDEKTK